MALRVEATVSPKVERKMVYAGASQASYQVASDDLQVRLRGGQALCLVLGKGKIGGLLVSTCC